MEELTAVVVLLTVAIFMRRTSSDAKLAVLEADVRERGEAWLAAARARFEPRGITVVVTEGLRTQERQRELYAQGRTTPGPIVTWTMDSKHLKGRAFDFAFVVDGAVRWDMELPWTEAGELGESMGLTWGGRWHAPDRPHFEA